jgi:hypothetical protein
MSDLMVVVDAAAAGWDERRANSVRLANHGADAEGDDPVWYSVLVYDFERLRDRREIRSFFIQEVDCDKVVLTGSPLEEPPMASPAIGGVSGLSSYPGARRPSIPSVTASRWSRARFSRGVHLDPAEAGVLGLFGAEEPNIASWVSWTAWGQSGALRKAGRAAASMWAEPLSRAATIAASSEPA